MQGNALPSLGLERTSGQVSRVKGSTSCFFHGRTAALVVVPDHGLSSVDVSPGSEAIGGPSQACVQGPQSTGQLGTGGNWGQGHSPRGPVLRHNSAPAAWNPWLALHVLGNLSLVWNMGYYTFLKGLL